MKFRSRLLQSMQTHMPNPEVLPMVPIVELAGCSRLLVENHRGVTQYSTEQIGIKMKYGLLTVCGCRLTLEHMTKVKLVITGDINSIFLTRGCEA